MGDPYLPARVVLNVDRDAYLACAACSTMCGMSEGSESATQAAIKTRLRADWEWLAEQGIRLSQWGPDLPSGKVRVYLQRYSDEARHVLENRYRQDIVVDTESASGVPGSAITSERGRVTEKANPGLVSNAGVRRVGGSLVSHAGNPGYIFG
jgi:hypothetical protein